MRRNILSAISETRKPRIIEPDFPGHNIPIPGAGFRRRQRTLKTGLGCAQRIVPSRTLEGDPEQVARRLQ